MGFVPAVALSLLLLLGLDGKVAAYVPEYGTESGVLYSAGAYKRFPDVTIIVEDEYRYFISELNFEEIQDKILTGGADKLYFLSYDLVNVSEYDWQTDSALLSSCTVENPNFACRNHIRVYKKMPMNENFLLVCGTQAAQQSRCRTIDITGGQFIQDYDAVDVPDGVVSEFPEYNSFGEFRAENESDTVYFTAGHAMGPSISYNNITFGNPSDPNTLEASENFRTIDVNKYWLRSPVVFVDYYRANLMSDPTNPESQFYYVFLRENLHTDIDSRVSFDTIYSRVVRICRNDKGSDSAMGSHFLTYMKARILCSREVPSGREFAGDIKYQYNEIRSMVFNEGGRYFEDGDWQKMMYGAFSSPTLGPTGTAICAYRADVDGTSGIYDIFSQDLVKAVEGALDETEINHVFVDCLPDGRDVSVAQDSVVIKKDIVQMRTNNKLDPLLVLDDIYVTQMVLDRVCVAKSSDLSMCRNLDVLFLGTDTGKVVKVVMGIDETTSEVFPIISEEIALDDDGSINDLKIKEIGGVKYIFVTTMSKIYRLPLERCERHESCLDCIGSRDPYCVWNTDTSECINGNLIASEDTDVSVPSNLRQNVHTGEIPTLCALSPVCELRASALDYSTVQLEVFCDNTVSATVSIPALGVSDSPITLSSSTGTVWEDEGSTSYSGSHGLQFIEIRVAATGSTGAVLEFTACITTPVGPPLQLETSEVYADDNTATSLRVSLSIATFTDDFNDYQFRVRYSAPSQPIEMSTSFQSLTNGSSIVLPGFTPAETVTYEVDVMNSVGSISSQSFLSTLMDGQPGIPESVNVASITSTTLTFSWNAPDMPNGVIDGYTVQLLSENASIRVNCLENIGSSTTGNQYTFNGLIPYTNYMFIVQACNDAGEGTASPPVSARTDCGVAGQVQDFNFDNISDDTVCYNWEPPTEKNGDPNNIQYQVMEDCYLPTGVQSTDTILTSDSQCISGLDPRTHCCVTISAMNGCGTGLPVQFCEQTEDAVPGIIPALNTTKLSPTSLLLVWAPPSNYQRPGLMYSILLQDESRMTVNMYAVTDQTSYYIDGLSPNTLYYIGIKAASTIEEGPLIEQSVTTLPSPPPRPSNPNLTVDSTNLSAILTWELANAADYSVTGYYAVIRCNELEYSEMNTSGMSVTFDISDPGADFAWCTAQVQSVNDIGRSEYSELAQTVVPSRRPSQPRCFVVDDKGSQVTISFDVTHPFSLKDLIINYNLTSDIRTIAMEFPFISSSINQLNAPVSRNTQYSFSLVLCNNHGCSSPCDDLLNFTTSSDSPRPPDSITALEITWNSANITWEKPLLENETAIEYTIQISSADAEPRIVTGLTQRSWYFEDLRPETDYTTAVRVIDTVSGVPGLYGPIYSFQTLPGVPSEPRDVTLDYNEQQQLLEVFWAVPQTPNGTITMYEIQWSDSTGDDKDCDNPDGLVFGFNVTGVDLQNLEYKTSNTTNIRDSGTILVCVRAYTAEPGLWNYDTKIITTTGEQRNSGSDDECNTVTALAVVTAFLIASVIVLAILLIYVIHRFGRNCETKSTSEVGGLPPESETASTIKGDSNLPTPVTPNAPFSTQSSYLSQNSVIPLLPPSQRAGSDSGLSGNEPYDTPIWKSEISVDTKVTHLD